MGNWSDGTIQPPAAEAMPLAAAITVASPAAAGPAAAGPIIGDRNAKMPENACAESVAMLLIALAALIASPAAIPSPFAAVRAAAPASVAVDMASSLAIQLVTILTPRLTNSAIIDCAIFATAFCNVVVPNIMPVIDVSNARWIGCIRLCQVLWLVCTARESRFSFSL